MKIARVAKVGGPGRPTVGRPLQTSHELVVKPWNDFIYPRVLRGAADAPTNRRRLQTCAVGSPRGRQRGGLCGRPLWTLLELGYWKLPLRQPVDRARRTVTGPGNRRPDGSDPVVGAAAT